MTLPENILIQCPDKRFAFRTIKACFDCDHYMGLSKPVVNGVEVEDCRPEEIHVICGRPATRKLTMWIDE